MGNDHLEQTLFSSNPTVPKPTTTTNIQNTIKLQSSVHIICVADIMNTILLISFMSTLIFPSNHRS